MIESASTLLHFDIQATDGDIGRIVDVFFDDATWTVRYFVVEAGGWLHKRRVLVSPIAVTAVNEDARSLGVNLTREQIEHSPLVDTEMPLSRQMELKYRDYFSWPLYWIDTFLEAYDGGVYPRLAAADEAARAGRATRHEPLLPGPPKGDPHLRSAHKVMHYTVIASDGPAGRLEDMLVDSDGWIVQSLIVHVDQVPQRGRVLAPPNVVADVSWSMSAIHTRLTRREMGNLPAAA